MSPRQIDSKVDYRRLGQLSNEFTELWKRQQALYLDAAAGFSLVRAHVVRTQGNARSSMRGTELDSDEFQDTRMFTYDEIFSGDFCTSSIHRSTQGEVKTRNSPGGANLVALGQMCLVSFYDYWNEYLRREVVRAQGSLPTEKDKRSQRRALSEHGSHDLWGDIRILRISIVHKRGIATSDVVRCRLIKWFKPGDPIALTPEHMRTLFLALLRYRNELFKTQFPPRRIRVTR